jgi:hypothetical protein
MSDTKPASSTPISLSQAVLAPLDAVFKAQIHGARSFLNMLWQIAYPHIEIDDNGNPVKEISDEDKKPYSFPISFETQEGDNKRTVTINIPSIAMVPVTPLGVEEATIRFSMSVTEIGDHRQLQATEAKKFESSDNKVFDRTKRPWFLVECPVSLRGNVVANSSQDTSIEINIKLSRSPIPAALEKSLTVLTQTITTQTEK